MSCYYKQILLFYSTLEGNEDGSMKREILGIGHFTPDNFILNHNDTKRNDQNIMTEDKVDYPSISSSIVTGMFMMKGIINEIKPENCFDDTIIIL